MAGNRDSLTIDVARAILLGLLATACGVTEVVDRDANGEAILIRSPQPDAADLRTLHDRFGVRTVLNLRGENPEKGWFVEEARGVDESGLRWVHLPISGRSAPDPTEIEAFFEIVEDPDNWPVLVHCAAGLHRTGLVVALYRIQHQGWPNRAALDEMLAKGFHWSWIDRRALEEAVLRYRPDPERRRPRRGAVASERRCP